VRFVLTNTTDKAIPVFQRWNSWGAYQWRIAIRDGAGLRAVAVNPQQGWTRNAPTAIAIEPHAELALTALVQEETTSDRRPGLDRFVTHARVAYPIEVRGIFDCPKSAEPALAVGIGAKTLPASELWVGAIASPWLEVR